MRILFFAGSLKKACVCRKGFIFDEYYSRCKRVKTIMSTCSKSYECIANSVCASSELTYSKQCTCVPGYYFEDDMAQCVPQLNHGAICSQNHACNLYLGLHCSIGKNCTCQADYFWNYSNCELSYTYGESCNSTMAESCRVSRSLYCNANTSKCECFPGFIFVESTQNCRTIFLNNIINC